MKHYEKSTKGNSRGNMKAPGGYDNAASKNTVAKAASKHNPGGMKTASSSGKGSKPSRKMW